MRILIVEDEPLAQAKLESMLTALDPSIVVQEKIGSVKDAIKWLQNHRPDVAFVDIQLSDDHSFEIFRKIDIQFPVIFTTAYDKYLLESFEFNSIDYLLKPITEDKLRRSLTKLRNLEQHFMRGNIDRLIKGHELKMIDRIVVKKGGESIALDLKNIAYFFTEHRIVFAKDFEGRQFITDKNLTELEGSLDHEAFFRINRKYIANKLAITRFRSQNGKVRISLQPETREEIFVSKETAPAFRGWIGSS